MSEKIKQFIEANGYSLGSHGRAPHQCGLPSGGVMVRPEYSKVDGAMAVVVYPDRVILATLRIPYYHNDWVINSTRPYSTKQELLSILDELIPEKTNCW